MEIYEIYYTPAVLISLNQTDILHYIVVRNGIMGDAGEVPGGQRDVRVGVEGRGWSEGRGRWRGRDECIFTFSLSSCCQTSPRCILQQRRKTNCIFFFSLHNHHNIQVII